MSDLKIETKKGFVRGVWGIYDVGGSKGKAYSRRTKIDNDIILAKLNPYAPKCKVYIFGEDNFKILTDKGFDTVLIDKKPICWDMVNEQYRHKIEIWKYGLKDFDEIVFLDWDCVPCAPIPADFWDVMGSGAKIRSTIYMYVRKRLFARKGDERKLSASTFLYIRGKEQADEIIKTWERIGRPWQEELALSQYMDDINGGWKGYEDFRAKYEQPYHTLFFHYPAEYYKDVCAKNSIFYHLNCKIVAWILGDRSTNGIKERLDAWQKRSIDGFMTVWNNKVKEQQKK
jgi:hypothetical protein